MSAIGFRIRLLLVMMLLLGGVTGATLYITQKRVQAAYLQLYQDQFESEVNYFTVQQDNRLSGARNRCEELARLPELHALLKSEDTNALYELATNFLNRPTAQFQRATRAAFRRTNGIAATVAAQGGAGLLRNNLSFFRVLNAKGKILRLPDNRGVIKQVARQHLEDELATVQRAIETLEEQPIGYLAPERTNGAIELLEVIVTKVSDSDTKETLGALVLGLPFLETSEKAMNDLSRGGIESGIWVENRLHSQTITNNVREDFAKLVLRGMKASDQPRDVLDVTLGGVPRRVFFKLLNPNSPFPPAYEVSLFSMASALNTERELRLQILAFSAAALAAALILTLLLAHGLSTPLRELVAATDEIRSGNLRVKVPVRGKDEIGQLAESFNEMADGLEQRERYRTLLNMVTDEKVAHALTNGQLSLGGEVREVSVLFCDIRGFTALTENMPPEEVIEMLNEHMTTLTRVVKDHHGVLDKFVGDLLMAIFGAPTSHENDALNAVRCSLRLRHEREKLNATSQHSLKIGIGIATGKVVAGCMGSADRLNYTVLGERVNLASRLCSQAGPGQIIIDQNTKDKLGETVSVTELPPFAVKGFSEDIVAYELTGVYSWDPSEY